MKVQDATVKMDARHELTRKVDTRENFLFWVGDRPSTDRGGSPPVALTLSEEAKRQNAAMASANARCAACSRKQAQDAGAEADPQISLLEKMIEMILGKKIRLRLIRPLGPPSEKAEQAQQDISAAAAAQNAVSGAAPAQSQGWGLIYDRQERIEETEMTSFEAGALVRTQDGRDITLQVQLNLSRSFVGQNELSLRAGDAAAQVKDPLVLNFDGNAAQLGPRTVRFDLDADGTEDQISSLAGNSAFLVLDRNEDGVVNDGRELFGPTTGDGFAELAAHDADGNRWIDENDPIFNKLRLWRVDGAGNSTLAALGEVGIGAIYLDAVSTPFSYNDAANESLGQLRATGLFLQGNGAGGTIQQVDLKA
ncbi:MAG: hypothetical protein M0036_08975 [Desulfobacteraceae bacterium]|nr:hypothetical protein [Desulfobacteraceae bacterium]